LNRFIRFILFGNYFYGICVIALTIEATLQQRIPFNSFIYYCLIFLGTVFYYTYAYIGEQGIVQDNPRSKWYDHNKKLIGRTQQIMTLAIAGLCIGWLIIYPQSITGIDFRALCILIFIPLIALLYYGSESASGKIHNLRNQGWIKPFVIGLVWAGMVTLYPVIFQSLEQNIPYRPKYLGFLLFFKNLMFITMLCILFDIKDYAADHNQQLKTFVVRYGLRKTIYFILIPLTVLGLGSFLLFAYWMHFPLLMVFINTLPFILLIIVARSMQRRKSILYYLAIIDGLMLVKAVCGIIGFSLLKQ
jgi:4-hydroxybenzoate polyprenyltransferase